MATSSDVLSLKAKLDASEFVAGSQKLIASLRSMLGVHAAANKSGTEGSIKFGFANQDLRKSILDLGKSVKEVLTPSIAGLGLAGVGVSAAIAGAIKSVKDFGKAAEDLKFTSSESGFNTKQVESWTSGMEAFGDSTEAAHGKLIHFGAEFEQFHQRRKSAFDDLATSMSPRIRAMMEDLRNSATPEIALEKAQKIAESLEGIDRKRFADATGLGESFARLNKGFMAEKWGSTIELHPHRGKS